MLLGLPSFAVERSCNLQHLALFRPLVVSLLHSLQGIPCSEPKFENSTVYHFTTRSVTVALVLLVVICPETASLDPVETCHGFFCEHSASSSFDVLWYAGYSDICLL